MMPHLGGPMNFQFACISHWHRVSILISIVAESVIKRAETMARMSGATVNSSPVNPSTTVPHRWYGSCKRLQPRLLSGQQII